MLKNKESSFKSHMMLAFEKKYHIFQQFHLEIKFSRVLKNHQSFIKTL